VGPGSESDLSLGTSPKLVWLSSQRNGARKISPHTRPTTNHSGRRVVWDLCLVAPMKAELLCCRKSAPIQPVSSLLSLSSTIFFDVIGFIPDETQPQTANVKDVASESMAGVGSLHSGPNGTKLSEGSQEFSHSSQERLEQTGGVSSLPGDSNESGIGMLPEKGVVRGRLKFFSSCII